MSVRLASALLLALAAAYVPASSVRAERGVLTYRVSPWDGTAPVSAETLKAAADVVAKRFQHACLSVASVTPGKSGDALEIRLGPSIGDGEPQVRRLAERRGAVEFRVRAQTEVEDRWRDKRLMAGEAPPPSLEWKEQEGNILQALVETPEKALAVKLTELQKKDPPADAAALKAAQTDYDAAVAAGYFTNEQIAVTSVQRSRAWGAQGLTRIAVRFEFRDDRKAAFEKFTGSHKGRPLCVIVDGRVHVAPVIGAALPGMGELTGAGAGYTDAEAQEMAAIFESGPLPCRLTEEKDK